MSKMTKSEAGLIGAIQTHNILVNRYIENPAYCEFCNKQLPYEKRKNKYCNRSCSASKNNKSIVRNYTYGKYINKKCLFCGIDTTNLKYCSNSCKQKHAWEKVVECIDAARCLPKAKNGVYGYNPSIAKRYLADKRGRRCEICKGESWMGNPIPLILDHINGNPNDNLVENLRLVCGNCNMLLPTFAGRNKGKGRKARYL